MSPDSDIYAAGLTAVLERVATTLDAVEDFPFVADPKTGAWETTDDGNWCGGHWIGLLWMASAYADGDRADELADAAYGYFNRMTGSGDLLGSMFTGMNYLYAGFRGYDVTGDRRLFGVGLTGADATVANVHRAARVIPVGEYRIEGPAKQFDLSEATEHRPVGSHVTAVDIIYTALPVLWRAYEETGNPRFRDTAVAHTDRHLDWHIREDGSTWHEAAFDPATGELERQYNELAYSDETCWARGQGWNVAGLARAYRETRADRYLAALERTTEYYLTHTPQDLVPRWDFEVPDPENEPRDTSAAALAAYGLARLDGDRVPPAHRERVAALRTTGERVLTSLVENYVVTDPADDRYGMVQHGCYSKPSEYAMDNELVWTDYYVAYALDSLMG